MQVIILAAGMGSRLGNKDLPKPLTPLANGESLLGFQLHNLASFISLDDVLIVVGYCKEKIMEKFPYLLYVYNPDYAKENTSKSLLRALHKVDQDVVWINGDVVFHPSVLKALLDFDKTAMVVNQGRVGEEEVKYRSDSNGKILEVSKQVANPQGEALGLNLVKAADLKLFKEELAHCEKNDYFEKGIEKALKKGMSVWSVPVDSNMCTEVDFPEDLTRANTMIKSWISTR